MYFHTCELIYLRSPTYAGYSITSNGVSCADEGMTGLNDEAECESAAPKIQSLVPNSVYYSDDTWVNRPPGCFYHHGRTDGILYGKTEIYWNRDENGKTCSSCISVCKG